MTVSSFVSLGSTEKEYDPKVDESQKLAERMETTGEKVTLPGIPIMSVKMSPMPTPSGWSARAIKNILVRNGADPDQIETFSERQPVASNERKRAA